MIDRRRSMNIAMIGLGVFMISLGRFAAFGEQDTLFTTTLSRAGMETLWGWVMIASGAFQVAAGGGFLRWLDEHPELPRSTVVSYLASGLVLSWTWIVCYLMYGLSTPTVDVCGAVSIVLLAGAYREAHQGKMVRCGRILT